MNQQTELGDVKFVDLCDWPCCLKPAIPKIKVDVPFVCKVHLPIILSDPLTWNIAVRDAILSMDRTHQARLSLTQP